MGSSKPNVKKMEKDKDCKGLIKALNHDELDVRREAAGALGRLKDPEAVVPLIEALTDVKNMSDDGLYMLGDVASALGEIGDKRAVKPLENAIEADYPSVGGFSSLEEAARYGAEMNRRISYLRGAAKQALERIRSN